MFDRGRNFVINGGYFVDDNGHKKQSLSEVLVKLKDASALEASYDALNHESSPPVALSSELVTSLMSPTNNGDNSRLYFIHSIDAFTVRAYGESVARHCKEEHALLATVFFSRLLGIFPAQGKRVVPTLAYQLCVSPSCPEELKIEILGALHAEPNIPEQSQENQFQKLIIHPLLTTSIYLSPDSPVVFILDSVHDCENVEHHVKAVAQAVTALNKGGVNAKAVITSLSYQRVRGTFESQDIIKSTTTTLDAAIIGTSSFYSHLKARSFPLFDLKYNLSEPVQRAVEAVSAMCIFIGLPISVSIFVLCAGTVLGIGPFSFILALGAFYFTVLMELFAFSAGVSIVAYRELARFIWPRSI